MYTEHSSTLYPREIFLPIILFFLKFDKICETVFCAGPCFFTYSDETVVKDSLESESK